MATKNQIKPSQLCQGKGTGGYYADLPKYVNVEIVNLIRKEPRVEKVKIQYDFLPKYCKRCILQGHNEQDCLILHPELNQVNENNNKQDKSSHSNDKTKGEVSNINRVNGGGRYGQGQDHK